ncbi:MAG: hypothetical protein A2X49_09530 [Lentisphaerae bacterium GWF2_52_8]|nr:MAG: hypothetical protein A2X49_09530 [Lentisphaerae bacterium GWF2_52_8]
MRVEGGIDMFGIWSAYATNKASVSKSMSRISSGQILPTDDPAGIGISERMRAEIKGSAAAIANVDTAISTAQTSSSWIQSISTQLDRMKQLSVESGGIMSSTDRTNLNTEFKSLQQEITRISSDSSAAASFNGLYLLRGGNGIPVPEGDKVQSGTLSVQAGASTDQKISMPLSDLQVSNTQNIGTVSTYTYNSDNSVNTQTDTPVSWDQIINDVTGISADSPEAVGMIDKAVDFVAQASVNAAVEQKTLENRRDGLLSYQSNLTSSESTIRDTEMASESMQYSKAQILSAAGASILTQGKNIPAAALLQLLS